MTEQRETDEEIRERARRLHDRAHVVMDLLRTAAPHVQEAYRLLYDAGDSETDMDNKVTCYVMAGQTAAIIAQMNDLAREVHDPHRWGFSSVLDAVMETVLEEIFKHEQKAGASERKADA